jgi:hypothetical protein
MTPAANQGRLRTVPVVNRLQTALVAVPVVLLGVGLSGCGSGATTAARQAEVREAGTAVMPFDLDKTRHSFVKVDDGGVQTVIALDASDTEQVALIRAHLVEVRDAFAAGRFDDPATVHGSDMPGIAQLAAGASRIEIAYRDVAHGGEITYRTDDGALVGALHEWFDAQVADHGSDAVSEPSGHVMTEEMWRSHHPGQPYPGSTSDE